DHAVLELGFIKNDELNSVRDVWRRSVSHAQRFSSLVDHLFHLHVPGLHLLEIVQCNSCGPDLCETSAWAYCHNSDQDEAQLFHQPARTESHVLPKFFHNSSLLCLGYSPFKTIIGFTLAARRAGR